MKKRIKRGINNFLFPYKYNPKRYNDTFLCNSIIQEPVAQLEPAKEIVYCFWTGDNELTANRKSNLESIYNNAGVEVKLITKDNLEQYILPEHPLHPSFNNLSFVHRSDYLRTYFMHHHGGGYMDIKRCNKSWSPLFENLNNSNSYVIGYPEIGKRGAAVVDGIVGQDLRRYWHVLIGNCAYIFRPYTPITYDWYSELLSRMDKYAPALAINPGDAYGKNKGYPIPWTNILGDIFHPLCLKYSDKIIRTELLKPDFSINYR